MIVSGGWRTDTAFDEFDPSEPSSPGDNCGEKVIAVSSPPSMGYVALIILFMALPVGVLAISIGWMRGQPILLRILIVLAAFGAAGILFRFALVIVTAPAFDWNSGRVAAIVSLTKGYSLYPDPDSGVLSDWLYGPIPALLLTPIAICSTPTASIIFGALLNALFALVPAFWAGYIFARRSGRGSWLIGALLLFTFLNDTIAHEGLERATYMISPDAATMGFMCCACCFLLLRTNWLNLCLSAASAVLACWCKQSVVPFLVIPPLFLLATNGIKDAVRYLIVLVVAASLISGALLIKFNRHNMYWAMIGVHFLEQTYSPPGEVPRHFHFEDESHGMVAALFYGVGDWIADADEPLLLMLATITLCALVAHAAGESSKHSRAESPRANIASTRSMAAIRIEQIRKFCRSNPWIIFAMASVVVWPPSVLGYVKVFGYYNAFGPTTYFLFIAGAVGMIDLWPRMKTYIPQLPGLLTSVACLLVFFRGASAGVMSPGAMSNQATRMLAPYDNPQEVIYEYAKAHPGTAYFPWNPLSTLLAENQFYHFGWSFVDRLTIGRKPTSKQLYDHLPAHLRFVIYPPVFQGDRTLEMFPQINAPLTLIELPGYHVTTNVSIANECLVAAKATSRTTPVSDVPGSTLDLRPRMEGN